MLPVIGLFRLYGKLRLFQHASRPSQQYCSKVVRYLTVGFCTTAPPTATASMASSASKTTAAETLRKQYGCYFDEDGRLRNEETGGGFEFDVFDDRRKNQQRYEEIGEIIEKYIYELLETEGKLKRFYIPRLSDLNERHESVAENVLKRFMDYCNLAKKKNKGRGFIFRSEDAFECDRLLLIIHGSGVVRAGQWSRRMIINHSLESGSQLPYIKKAQELGYGVLVLNSNQHRSETNGKVIEGIDTPEKHFEYVWKEIVDKKCKASHVAIVAHSYGGHITVNGAQKIPEVAKKTFAVAFTDSVHYGGASNNEMSVWMNNNVCNWVSHPDPLDTPLQYSENNCPRVSAGTTVHEETSWKAFGSVWKFIDEKWQQVRDKKHDDMDAVTDSTTTKGFDGQRIKSDKNMEESPDKEKEEKVGQDNEHVQSTNRKSENMLIDKGELSSENIGTEVSNNTDDMSSAQNQKQPTENDDNADDSQEPMSQDSFGEIKRENADKAVSGSDAKIENADKIEDNNKEVEDIDKPGSSEKRQRMNEDKESVVSSQEPMSQDDSNSDSTIDTAMTSSESKDRQSPVKDEL